jgi:DNA-binding GntR family transcriptional regulator
MIPCSQEVGEQLKIASNDDIFLLKLIRYIDKQPVSIEESYVAAKLLKDPDEIQLSLYDYFRRQDIIPSNTQIRVSAQLTTNKVYRLNTVLIFVAEICTFL